jgi:hypothetical protein
MRPEPDQDELAAPSSAASQDGFDDMRTARGVWLGCLLGLVCLAAIGLACRLTLLLF